MLKLFDKTNLQMCVLIHKTYSLTKQLGNTFLVCSHGELNSSLVLCKDHVNLLLQSFRSEITITIIN